MKIIPLFCLWIGWYWLIQIITQCLGHLGETTRINSYNKQVWGQGRCYNVVMVIAGAFLFNKTRTKVALDNMKIFGPSEVISVREWYQPAGESDVQEPNFELIGSVANFQNYSYFARMSLALM